MDGPWTLRTHLRCFLSDPSARKKRPPPFANGGGTGCGPTASSLGVSRVPSVHHRNASDLRALSSGARPNAHPGAHGYSAPKPMRDDDVARPSASIRASTHSPRVEAG